MTAAKPSTWTGVRLEPLDVLFFRDGRPFGAATRASGGLPSPQTLAGALRTALLSQVDFDFARFAVQRRGRPLDQDGLRRTLADCGAPAWIIDTRFRGPWLTQPGAPNEPLVPVPAILARDQAGRWHRSVPLPPDRVPGWAHEDGLWPLWRRGAADARAAAGFLTLAGLGRFLRGELPGEGDHVEAHDLFGFDERTGIAVDGQTLTAAEGQIYGIRLLALRPGAGLYAEMLPGEGAPADGAWLPRLVPFGGEGKYVQAELTVPVAWPREPAGNQGTVLLLATPAFVGDKPWPPRLPGDHRLRAAASREPLAVSGWDVARGGPQPLRFAVPAGSVYFVEGDFAPPDDALGADAEQVAQGWGFVLRGTWKGDNLNG